MPGPRLRVPEEAQLAQIDKRVSAALASLERAFELLPAEEKEKRRKAWLAEQAKRIKQQELPIEHEAAPVGRRKYGVDD